MFRLEPYTRSLLVLLCVLTLGLRVTGAHVHLCLDGREPPAELHLQHPGDHHGTDDTHEDVDVDLAGHPLLKKGGVDHDLVGALPAVVLLYVLPPRTAVPELPEPSPAAVRVVHHLRPPLRGPPV